MNPNWDVKRAAEEDTKRRRREVALKKVADRKAAAKEAELKKKAEEAKKMEAGRKIKEENIEKNKKGVSIKEPLPTFKRSSQTDEAEQQAKKKQKLVPSSEIVVVGDQSPEEAPLTKQKEAEDSRRPSSVEESASRPTEGVGYSIPLDISYPRNKVQDAPPWVPRILIPSLQHPSGRPFTLEDSALNHPEEYLKGALPPRDILESKKNRMEDLHGKLMKNLISSTLLSMEVMARHKSLHHKSSLDDGYIKNLKGTIADLEKGQKVMEEELGEARQYEKAAKDFEQKFIAASSQVEASGRRLETIEKLLANKDEELLSVVGQLGEAKAGLSQARAEREEMAQEFQRRALEQSNLRAELERLKIELKSKTGALQQKDEELKESSSKAAEELKTRFDDFVRQMQDARNEYFLEGWEAAMQMMKIDPASSSYREVPFPNPHSAIPQFSFDRPPQTPTVDTLGLEEDLEEGEVEVDSSAVAEDARATSSRAAEGLSAEDQASLTDLVKSISSEGEKRE